MNKKDCTFCRVPDYKPIDKVRVSSLCDPCLKKVAKMVNKDPEEMRKENGYVSRQPLMW